MGKPAARITDYHSCPMVTGTVPHVGGPIANGSPNVFTGGLMQARVGDMAVCVGPPDVIAKGSSGVFVNGIPAARQGDQTAHGGVIVVGLPTVLIGETAGGGGGGAAQAAAGASLAYAAFEAQVKVLMDAAKSGTPFCEICFQKALAKLNAQLAATSAAAKGGAAAATSGVGGGPKPSIPLRVNNVIAAAAKPAGHIVDALSGAEAIVRSQAVNRALDAGLTKETAALHGEAVVKESPILNGMSLLGDGLAFVPAAEATGEVLGTDDYRQKVAAGSKAFGAMAGGAASIVAGGAAVAAVAALTVTAPVWISAVAIGGAAIVAGAAGYYVGSKVWNAFADKPFQNYWLGSNASTSGKGGGGGGGGAH